MAQKDEVVLLRVQLDEGKTTDRLQAIVLDMEKTKLAQAALTAARKQGTVTDEEYARASVELKLKLKEQQSEQTALTKNLELYRTAVNGVAGSYDVAQAQLTLAQRQYRGLAESAENSTEETKALSAVVKELRGTLKTVDADALDQHFRNIGNYPKAPIQELVQELVKLREEEKNLAAGSKELGENQYKQIGFMTAAQRAAAQAGQTYEEATKTIENYAKAIQPATAQLVQLEATQARLVESGEEASETYRKIGFQIAQAGAAVKEVPAETKKVSDRIAELDATTGAFGGRISGLKESFTAAKGGFDVATKGLSGVRVAMLALPLFALIAGLTALYAWFTKTQAGADFVERKMKGVSAIFGVLTDKASAAGKVLFEAFDNPKQAVQELLSAIGTNLLNRLKAFGVLWDAVRSGDMRKLNDGVIQFTTGIAEGSAKTKALVAELDNARKAGEAIAAEFQRIRDVERQINVERAQAKKDIEALKLVAEDVSKSTAERLESTRQAFALEQKSATAQLQAQRDRVANMEREARLTNQLTEQNDALAEERIKLAELEEGSLTRQIELNNKLNELRQQATERALADSKAYYERQALLATKGSQAELQARIGVIQAERDAQLAAQGLTENQRRLIITQSEQAIRDLRQSFRQAELQTQLGHLDIQLQQVKENSDEELNLLTRRLDTQHRLELANASLTIGQRKLLDAKYAADSDQVLLTTIRKRAQVALQVEANGIATRLTQVREGSEQEVALQREAIEKQRQQQLAAIGERTQAEDRAAQERLINANAERQQTDLTFQARTKAAVAHFQQERNELEKARAGGLITEGQYQATLLQNELGAATARRAIAEQLGKDTAAIDQEITDLRIKNLEQVTQAERAKAEERAAITEQFSIIVGQFLVDTLNDASVGLEDFARRSLLLLVDSVEKAVLAAQVKILVDSFAQADSIASFGATGGIRAALIIAAVTAATGPLKAMLSQPSGSGKKYAQGTVLEGPSHANGGIQIYSRNGHWFGEAEGGEPILTAGVSRAPHLLAAASAINVAAGGRPLVSSHFNRSPFMAQGGIATSIVRESLAGGSTLPSAAEIGEATAHALRKNPPVNRWADYKAAETRNNFTDTLGSS